MKPHFTLACILGLCAAASAAEPGSDRKVEPAAAAKATSDRRPNLVVFLTDDHSVLDSTAYGSQDVRTPNMRRLAERGLTFDRAFVASPSCAPSLQNLDGEGDDRPGHGGHS